MAMRAEFPPSTDIAYNPDPLREAVRASVTGLAIAIFSAVIWFYLRQASGGPDATRPRTEAAMHVIFPAVTSVLGTALGFYFGSQKR